MGKPAMCIKMLQVLNTGRLYSINELASILDTNPRNITEYVKELDSIAEEGGYGFYIEKKRGRYGGYRLNGNATIPALKLLLEEKEALLESYNYVLSKKDFVKKAALKDAFAKIMSNINMDNKNKEIMSIDKYQLTMNEEEIDKRYRFIEEAIKEKRCIEVVYMSLKNGEKTHILDPYKLFNYNNSWFFLAWNHEAGDVHQFKVNRIKEYKMLDKKFTIWKFYKPEDYFDEAGMRKNGTYHHVELIARGTRAMLFKERVYGKNQTITELEDGSIKVSLDMQDDGTMLSFALSCLDEATFIEPEWLVNNIKDVLSKIELIYKKDN